MKLFEVYHISMLTEDNKLAYIAKSIGPKIVSAAEKDQSARQVMAEPDANHRLASVLQTIRSADPTQGADAVVWLSRMYAKGLFRLEDVARVKNDLALFFKFRPKIANKDLNSYGTMADLYQATAPFENSSESDIQSRRQKERQIKHEGAEYLINTPNFKALVLHTHEAACYYGANTKWCTASADDSSAFDEYTEQGPIFVIMATGEDGKVHKFQFHVESGQFMDDRDVELSKAKIKFLSGFPEYSTFLNKLIKKHYFPNDPE